MREDILGGIKAAIERGATLKQAMMTFYRAGYKKEEIEEVARQYLKEKQIKKMQMQSPAVAQKTGKKEIKKPEKSIREQKPIQKISNYDAVLKPKGDNSIIILVIILILLLVGLAGIFIFREKVIDFFNNLF